MKVRAQPLWASHFSGKWNPEFLERQHTALSFHVSGWCSKGLSRSEILRVTSVVIMANALLWLSSLDGSDLFKKPSYK